MSTATSRSVAPPPKPPVYASMFGETLLKLADSAGRIDEDFAVRFLADGGIRVALVDTSHVQMLDIRVPPGLVKHESRTDDAVGFSAKAIKAAKAWLDPREHVKITVDRVQWKATLVQGTTRATIGAEDETMAYLPKVPKLTLPVSFTISAKAALRGKGWLKAGDGVGDYVILTTRNGKIRAEFKGESRALDIGVCDASGEARSLFNSRLLVSSIRAAAVFNDEVRVELGNDYPLSIRASTEDGITVHCLVAPRLES